MEYEAILAFLHRPNIFVVELTQRTMECSFGISPSDFIAFAESDINSNLQHKHVNALANAKRALDSQLICIFSALGIGKKRTKRWGIERKMQVLQTLGLVTPRISRRLAEVRNLMEHEFINPCSELVADMVDIISIFIAYTDTIMTNYSTEVTVALENENYEPSEEFVKLTLRPEMERLVVSSSFFNEAFVYTPDNEIFFAFLERLLFIRWGTGINPMVKS